MTEEDKDKYKALIDEAWDAYYEDDNKYATELCNRIIGTFKGEASPHFLLGLIEFDNKSYPSSVEHFEEAKKRDKEDKGKGRIYYWLARNYGEKGNFRFDGYTENPIYNVATSNQWFINALEYDDCPENTISYYAKQTDDIYKKNKIYKTGVDKFPETISIISEYVNILTTIKKRKEAYSLLEKKLKKITSITLNVQLGNLHFDDLKYEKARFYFNAAKELSEKKKDKLFSGLNYSIAKTYMKEDLWQDALTSFKKEYDEINDNNIENPDILNPEYLFSAFGIIAAYSEMKEVEKIEDFISSIPITERMLGYLHFSFSHTYEDNVYLASELELYDKANLAALNKAKSITQNKNIKLKSSFLKSLLYEHKNHQEYRLSSLKEAISYTDDYSEYKFIIVRIAEAYSNCFDAKIESKKKHKDLIRKLDSDLKNISFLVNEFSSYYLRSFINALHKLKDADSIVKIGEHFTLKQLNESEVLFEVAYSYNRIGKSKESQRAYEFYLKSNNHSSAVFNNLANLYKNKNDLGSVQKAIDLYQKAIKMDGEEEMYINNLKSAQEKKKNLLKEKNKKDLIENSFRRAQKLIKSEDYFTLETLNNFILKVQNDDDYIDNEIPISDELFSSFTKMSFSKADKIKDIWLSKNYIHLTNDFDEFNNPIYKINPYLLDEIKNVKSLFDQNEIPSKWISGIEGINVSKLEEVQYLFFIKKIGKINKKYRLIIERDFKELLFNYLVGNIKATIVLSGSFVELILTYYLEKKKIKTVKHGKKSESKGKKLYDCELFDLISFAEEKKYFGNDFFHLTNLSRIYRNFIHPGRELKEDLNKGKSDICFFSTLEIFKLI